MKLEVLLFATFSDIAGERKIVLDVAEPCSVASLIEALQQRFPRLGGYDFKRILVAVNQEVAAPDRLIAVGDEVGVFPPMSGGTS